MIIEEEEESGSVVGGGGGGGRYGSSNYSLSNFGGGQAHNYNQSANHNSPNHNNSPKETDKKSIVKSVLIKVICPNQRNLSFTVKRSSTIKALKKLILSSYNVKDLTPRLIYQGKLLQDSKTIGSYDIPNDSFIHCSLRPQRFRKDGLQQIQNLNNSNNSNNNSENGFALEEPVENFTGAMEPEVMGFDRLLEMGFDAAEIREFREQFYLSNQQLLNQQNQSNADILRLEDQFLNAELTAEEIHQAREHETVAQQELGSFHDLFLGMTMGFFMGLLIIFWIWDTHLSKRSKYGIVAGIACNFSFCLLRLTRSG